MAPKISDELKVYYNTIVLIKDINFVGLHNMHRTHVMLVIAKFLV